MRFETPVALTLAVGAWLAVAEMGDRTVAARPTLGVVAGGHAAPAIRSASARTADGVTTDAPRQPIDDLFRTSDRCLACHKGVSTSTGLDVSIGYDWRASMMANSARDPYWQAAVRREVVDHPQAREAIEAKCSRCHMPMANAVASAEGRAPGVFANLPVGSGAAPTSALAADGVSCAVCHQITPSGLGEESSWTGGFVISEETPAEGRRVYGPFEPDEGGIGIMRSATGLVPSEGPHVQSSELCASCHTLFTHAVRPNGGEGPEFPEQVPYLEWRASDFAAEGTSCQDCHMPEVGEDVPVTAVLGRPRENVSRHVFRGGNFFMLRMLARYRTELGVQALPAELALAARRTEDHLRTATASLAISDARIADGRVEWAVTVRNEAGHKFPTAFPSRRAWLHAVVRDSDGGVVFESGAFLPDGRIAGNDADLDATRWEPHYERITAPGEVQIYEAVMVDRSGAVTTGLMSAESWAKENRLLPRGFGTRDQPGRRIATVGAATGDDDFAPGSDRVQYSVAAPTSGPYTVSVELWFQPIAYRWAENLDGYATPETDRFVEYYRAMAPGSAIAIAAAGLEVR